jgi:hypothetical protein
MLLEQIAPENALGRGDSRWLPVPPGSVFAELQKIMPDEIALVRIGLKVAKPLMPFVDGKPLYAQMLDAGFAVMGVMPLREVLLGRVGKLTGVFAPEPRIKDKRALNEYAEPGHVKTVLAFQLAQETRDGVSGTNVTFAVRIWGVDAAAQRKIKLAWPVGNAFGGKFAKAWLVALDRRLSPKPAA